LTELELLFQAIERLATSAARCGFDAAAMAASYNSEAAVLEDSAATETEMKAVARQVFVRRAIADSIAAGGRAAAVPVAAPTATLLTDAPELGTLH
jgi:hypothetical protein